MRLAFAHLFSLVWAVALLACTSARVDTANDSPPEQEEAQCTLRDSYQFGRSGGMTRYDVSYALEPPNVFTAHVRYRFGEPDQSCSGTLPLCESTDRLAVADLNELLLHPVVLDAWPASGDRLWGRDLRPVDAPLLAVSRTNGGTILIGQTCGERDNCTQAPPQVRQLKQVLGRLAGEIMATPECEGLEP